MVLNCPIPAPKPALLRAYSSQPMRLNPVRSGFQFKIINDDNKTLAYLDDSQLSDFVLVDDYINQRLIAIGKMNEIEKVNGFALQAESLKKEVIEFQQRQQRYRLVSMELIDGKQIASDIVDELTHEVATIEGEKPCIAFIRVGEDPASVSYVRGKNQTAEKIGIRPLLFTFEEDVSQEELFAKVDELNGNPSVNGILIQSPLPKHLNEQAAFNRIDPDKDVDGFHVVNAGRVVQEDATGFVSCTPAGIIEICRREGISLEGKHVVVLGRSLIVGKTFY